MIVSASKPAVEVAAQNSQLAVTYPLNSVVDQVASEILVSIPLQNEPGKAINLVKISDSDLTQLVHSEIEKGNCDSVKLLLDGSEISKRALGAILICAVRHQKTDILRFLLSLDKTINDEDYGLAFVTAAREGYLDVIELLWAFKITINDENFAFAFVAAANAGQLDVLRFLFSLDRTIKDDDFRLCLLSAAESGYLTIVKYLLSIREISCSSLIFKMKNIVSNGHFHIVEFLLKKVFSSKFEEIIEEILNYKNVKIKSFLIDCFLKINPEKLERVLSECSSWIIWHKFTKRQIDRFQLLILVLESLPFTVDAQGLIKVLRSNIKFFKDHKKQQAFLQLMNALNSKRMTSQSYQKVSLLLNSLNNRDSTSLDSEKDLLRMIQLLTVIFTVAHKDFIQWPIEIINIKYMSDFLIKKIDSHHLLPDKIDCESCLSAIMGLRHPGDFFGYLAKFLHAEEEMKIAIKKIIKGIVEPSIFTSERNLESPHLQRVSSIQHLWTSNLDPIFNLSLNHIEVKMDIFKFLEKALVKNKHAEGYFENLIRRIKEKEGPSGVMSDLEVKIYSLIEQEGDQLLKNLESIRSEMEKNRLDNLEFYNDIKILMDQLSEKKPNLKGFTLIDSDDIQDLIFCGTEVKGSCQRLDDNSSDANWCLPGYVLDGKIRILAVKDCDSRIVSRAIIKIMFNESNQPVIFFEKIYGDQRFSLQLVEYAQMKASQVGIPLYKEGQEIQLASIGNVAPFEYEDGMIGAQDFEFEIENMGVGMMKAGVYTIRAQPI